jgi:hypothetical protein
MTNSPKEPRSTVIEVEGGVEGAITQAFEFGLAMQRFLMDISPAMFEPGGESDLDRISRYESTLLYARDQVQRDPSSSDAQLDLAVCLYRIASVAPDKTLIVQEARSILEALKGQLPHDREHVRSFLEAEVRNIMHKIGIR